MHTPDWRQSLRELCRVSRDRVVFDYPALSSAAALQAAARHAAHALGRRVEAYRVFGARAVRCELAANGFRLADTHRQFVLPIAFHKRLNSAAATGRIEGALARAGLTRLLGSPVTVVAERVEPAWPSVPSSGSRRTTSTGCAALRASWSPGRPASRADTSRARSRPAATTSARWSGAPRTIPGFRRGDGRQTWSRPARAGSRRSPRSGSRSRAPPRGSTSSTTSRRSTGRRRLRDEDYRAVNATAVRTVIEAARVGGRAAGRALQHRRRPRGRRASAGQRGRAAQARATSIRRRSSKGSGSRAKRRRETGVEVVIARPTGIYGPGDRRLLKLFRGVARRRFVILGDGRHLLSPHLHRRSRRRLPSLRRRAGRGRPHLHPRGRRGDDAERADGADRGGGAACRRRACTCRCGRSGSRAPPAKPSARPFGIEPPLYRRRVDFFTKSRAFDISRARAELGYAPKVGLQEGFAGRWRVSGEGVAVVQQAAEHGRETLRAGGRSRGSVVWSPDRTEPSCGDSGTTDRGSAVGPARHGNADRVIRVIRATVVRG